jgi:signal transduction histidine kinase
LNAEAPAATAAAAEEARAPRGRTHRRSTGSLSRRMIGIAAVWIAALLLIGGFALDRVLTRSIVANFDDQLVTILKGMLGSAEIDPIGEVRFSRALADQRFVEAYSGLYYQVTAVGADPRTSPDQVLPSRSLWDRRLKVDESHSDLKPHIYDSNEFSQPQHIEPLRIVEQDAILPGSNVRWRFQVAASRESIDEQIRRLRLTLFWSFAALGFGLLILAALQTFYGLWPLRRVRREVASIRSGEMTRIGHDFPAEIRPLTEEINQLLAHSEAQAEEARRHAGNLAHALKTPLTVITNAATANSPDLAAAVCR